MSDVELGGRLAVCGAQRRLAVRTRREGEACRRNAEVAGENEAKRAPSDDAAGAILFPAKPGDATSLGVVEESLQPCSAVRELA